MSVRDTIVFDPREFVPERVELDLESLGLTIDSEGADWGESQVQANLVRRAMGELPSDLHLPNVDMSIPLQVKKESSVSLAEAAQNIQMKVGLWQTEHGFIRRDFDLGDFAGSIAYRVFTPALSGFQGWHMAHREHAPDVTIKMSRHPVGYGTRPVVSTEFSESSAREMIWEIADVLGTAPGLMRQTILNDGSAHWRGIIAAIESRDHPQDATADTTAKLAYEAEALTALGGSAIATRTGASGAGGVNNVIRHSSLNNLWQVVLGSQIAASGHMTHVGRRRFWVRIYDPSTSAGQVRLRLEYRSLGANRWHVGSEIPTRIAGDFDVIDLGECTLARAVLGSQRWEWRITAASTSGRTLDIDKVWIFPTEQMLRISESISNETPSTFVGLDNFSSAGALTGKVATVGGTWRGAGDADDFTVV